MIRAHYASREQQQKLSCCVADKSHHKPLRKFINHCPNYRADEAKGFSNQRVDRRFGCALIVSAIVGAAARLSIKRMG